MAAVALAAFLVGCSDPTLEEACADYCDAIAAADCPSSPADQCAAQCDQLREQLDGKCQEEYTEVLSCVAEEEYECQDGSATPVSGGCVEETFAVLECVGLDVEDGGASDG